MCSRNSLFFVPSSGVSSTFRISAAVRQNKDLFTSLFSNATNSLNHYFQQLNWNFQFTGICFKLGKCGDGFEFEKETEVGDSNYRENNLLWFNTVRNALQTYKLAWLIGIGRPAEFIIISIIYTFSNAHFRAGGWTSVKIASKMPHIDLYVWHLISVLWGC